MRKDRNIDKGRLLGGQMSRVMSEVVAEWIELVFDITPVITSRTEVVVNFISEVQDSGKTVKI